MLSWLFIPISCFKSLTETNIVYDNNFENYERKSLEIQGWNSTVTNFGPISDTKIRNYNGSNMLGLLNDNQVSLNLVNLPSHQALRVEFDLYIHNIWKNDLWGMSFDGAYQLLTGFSNDPSVKQSYPNWIGNGSSLAIAGTNAITTSLPGTCSYSSLPKGSSMYKIVTTVSHSNSNFELRLNDAGGVVNDSCNRSWSLDNLKVTILKNN